MRKRRDRRTTRLTVQLSVFACLVLAVGALAGVAALYAQDADAAGESPRLVVQWVDRTPVTKTTAERPQGSEDGSLVYDPERGRVIFYGGKDDTDFGMNETWSLDPAERRWTKLAVNGRTPPPSEDHTAIYDPNSHRMILFGGENGPTSNKLWAFDLKTITWKEIATQGPRRESHSAVYDSRGKRMVVFGGSDRTESDLYDLWALDLDPKSPTFEKWQNLTVATGRLPGRIDHAAVYDPVKNRMVLHGGWTKIRRGLFGDTWAFYFADTPGGQGRWERISTPTAPPPRRHAVPVHDPDRNLFLLIGGQGQSRPLNDVWIFDLTRDVWVNASPAGPGPVPRIDHQAVYDPRTRSVLLYGGDSMTDDAVKLRDIWELVLPPVPALSSSRGVQ